MTSGKKGAMSMRSYLRWRVCVLGKMVGVRFELWLGCGMSIKAGFTAGEQNEPETYSSYPNTQTQLPTTMRASFKQLALLFLGLASQGIAMASPPTDSINADPKSLFAVNINNEVLGVSVKSLFQTTHTRT